MPAFIMFFYLLNEKGNPMAKLLTRVFPL